MTQRAHDQSTEACDKVSPGNARDEGTLFSFADQRDAAAMQRTAAALVEHSPRLAAQRALNEQIHRSPQVTQCRAMAGMAADRAANARPNDTGLPDRLKSGIEHLSGIALDDVKVHYNSPRPAQLQALAYAQGSDIHIGPRQEGQLAHEAWHVVQQKQGRVQANGQVDGIAINDDHGLEREADVLGARANRLGADGVQALPSTQPAGTRLATATVLDSSPVLQGNFPDAYNDTRREEQRIPKDAVQLDHMVPQATLKMFVATYKILGGLTSDPGSKWESTKDAMASLRTAVRKFPLHGHELMSEGHLINLPQNIVPGLGNQIQGAGDDFDPQVALVSSAGNHDRYEETAVSVAQRAMDLAMNKLNGLVDASVLPSTAAASKNSRKHDTGTDALLAAELTTLAGAFDALSAAPEPAYDATVWYGHGDEDKHVKKRAADWVKDAGLVVIRGTPAPARAAWQHQFTFATDALGKHGEVVKVVPVTVTVAVDVSAATWQHLYDRHYLPTFAGTVEAVDTFWKTDPHVYLTGAAGTGLLEQELALLLKKSFNFSKPYDNLGAPGEEIGEATWSKAAHKLFFQGNITSTLAAAAIGGISYDVDTELKSIAPQDPTLAFALLPDQL